MSDSAEWTFFCELSAFGIQEKTSAAIVAESDDIQVWVVPVDSFLTFAEGNPQFHVLFYKNITKRLAQMLRGLHSRFFFFFFFFFFSFALFSLFSFFLTSPLSSAPQKER